MILPTPCSIHLFDRLCDIITSVILSYKSWLKQFSQSENFFTANSYSSTPSIFMALQSNKIVNRSGRRLSSFSSAVTLTVS